MIKPPIKQPGAIAGSMEMKYNEKVETKVLKMLYLPNAARLAIHEASSFVIEIELEFDWSCGRKIAE